MTDESVRMPLSDEELRQIGGWAADCAARALPLFEAHDPSDKRPHAALDAIRSFSRGERRTARLRSAAVVALAAARDAREPAAAAAARAVGCAASTAYMHPLATLGQAKHLLAPAVYAARARELATEDAGVGDAELLRAIEHAPPAVREVLRRMPARGPPGRGRVDALLCRLDAGLRAGGPGRERS